MRGPCISCSALPRCKKATPEMVALLDGCGIFEQVGDPVLNARVRAVDLFGPEVVVKTKQKPGQVIDMDIIGSRKYLRKVAVLSGAVSQGKSFPMKAEALAEAISGLTDDNGDPMYPGVAEMDDDALQALAATMGGKPKPEPKTESAPEPKPGSAPEPKPKPKPRTRRKKKPPVEQTPPAAEETPPNEAPKAKPGRRPSRKKKPVEVVPPPTETNALVIDMLKTIGAMLDKSAAANAALDEQVTALQGEVSNLTTKLQVIEEHLCWVYNGEQEPGNEISSLDGTTWV